MLHAGKNICWEISRAQNTKKEWTKPKSGRSQQNRHKCCKDIKNVQKGSSYWFD